MAGAKPGVHIVQLKPIVVPEFLIRGNKFIKWDDDSTTGVPVTLKVDPKGYVLYWKDQHKEMDCLDISMIRDVRTAKYAKLPKDPKVKDTVTMGAQDTPLEDKMITIVYGTDMTNCNFLNFAATCKEVAQDWTSCLFEYCTNLLAQNCSTISFLEKCYTKLTLITNHEGKVPVKFIIKMFAQHKEDKKRIEKALEVARLPFDKNDTVDPSKFTFADFLNFYRHLCGRSEVDKIFHQLGAKKKPYLTAEQFKEFLNTSQRDPRLNEILYPYYDIKKAQDLIDQFEPNHSMAHKGHLSQEGFLRFLLSDENALIPPEKLDISQDMDQPLTHYFINSSHNTYLTGHQLTGRSSVEIYRQALLTGCRCVELDCWDGKGTDEEPIITHGFTMCSEILFKEVIEAIAETAFKVSDFPVILSFENHCSQKQQAKMAAHCRNILGDMLLTDPIDGHPLDPDKALPSPDQLLRRILIKNKKRHVHKTKKTKLPKSGSVKNKHSSSSADKSGPTITESPLAAATGNTETTPIVTTETQSSVTSTEGSTNTDIAETLVTPAAQVTIADESQSISSGGDVKEVPTTVEETPAPIVVQAQASVVSGVDGEGDDDLSDSDTDTEDEDDEGLTEEEAKLRMTEEKEKGTAGQEAEAGMEMSALVNYIQPVHFHSFEHADKRNRSYECVSFVETQASSFLKEFPVEFVNYNKRQLSRIYPKGTRVDSSNYMPQIFWNAGCQLVALNFQTLDLAMQLNLGIFEYNGRSGYILKPDFMRRKDRQFDPFAESTVDGIIAGSVEIKIISGQFLSEKKIGTYVEVEMYGLPADTVRKKHKTKTVPANGISPVYEEEPFKFKKVVLPNLATLRIFANDENGKLLGHRVLPVEGLRPGFRHINLRNELNQPLPLATIFVHIKVGDFVPDAFADFAEALTNPIAYQSKLEKHAQQLAVLEEDFEVDEVAEEVPPSQTPAKELSRDRNGSLMSKGSSHTNDTPTVSRVGSLHNRSLVKQPSTVSGQSQGSQGSGPAANRMMSTVSASISESGSKSLPGSPMHNVKPQTAGENGALKPHMPVPQAPKIDVMAITKLKDQDVIDVPTIEELKEGKQYVKIMAKMEKELDSLRKKQEKARNNLIELHSLQEEKLVIAQIKMKSSLEKTHRKSFKRASKHGAVDEVSSKNQHEITTLLTDQEKSHRDLKKLQREDLLRECKEQLKVELDLVLKYQPLIYDALLQLTDIHLEIQSKKLDNIHAGEVMKLKRELEIQNKEEMKSLAKKHKDKSELERMKREARQKHITLAVQERKKLQDIVTKRKSEAMEKYDDLKKAVDEERARRESELRDEFDAKCQQREEEIRQAEEECSIKPTTRVPGDTNGDNATTGDIINNQTETTAMP